MGGKTSWLAALVTRVVLVLGLAYVSLWWSYQHFYSVFAISPDDVGLAPSGGGFGDVFGAVLRLGLWLSIALLALGLLPVICIALALYAIEHPRIGGGPTERVGAAFLALGLLAAIIFANAKFVSLAYAGVVIAVVVLVTFVCWRRAVRHPIGDGPTPPFSARWWSARQKWLLRMSDLFLVIAVIGVLFIDLPGDAHDVARTLLKEAGTKNECKVPGIGAPLGRFRLDLLNVRGIPATFAVATLPRGLPSQRPFDGIYLGSANGWIVIYQKVNESKGRILRIPNSSGASIIVDARLPNCEGVH